MSLVQIIKKGYKHGGKLTSAKSKEILNHDSVRGIKLTPKQKRFFAAHLLNGGFPTSSPWYTPTKLDVPEFSGLYSGTVEAGKVGAKGAGTASKGLSAGAMGLGAGLSVASTITDALIAANEAKKQREIEAKLADVDILSDDPRSIIKAMREREQIEQEGSATLTKGTIGRSALSGTLKGASAGASFGPVGAAVGAGVGLIGGLVTGGVKSKRMKEAEAERKKQSLKEINVYMDEAIQAGAGDENYKLFKGGGKVKGPGTGKSDSISGELQPGSFVVPAENAKIAERLREIYFKEKGTKRASLSKGSVPVKISNKEHVFTPEETQTLLKNGVNLNLLAPNAKEKVGFVKGGWIQGAIKRPGAFTAKSKAAGMGIQEYASHVLKEGSTASTRTKRQAALARTLSKISKKQDGGVIEKLTQRPFKGQGSDVTMNKYGTFISKKTGKSFPEYEGVGPIGEYLIEKFSDTEKKVPTKVPARAFKAKMLEQREMQDGGVIEKFINGWEVQDGGVVTDNELTKIVKELNETMKRYENIEKNQKLELERIKKSKESKSLLSAMENYTKREKDKIEFIKKTIGENIKHANDLMKKNESFRGVSQAGLKVEQNKALIKSLIDNSNEGIRTIERGANNLKYTSNPSNYDKTSFLGKSYFKSEPPTFKKQLAERTDEEIKKDIKQFGKILKAPGVEFRPTVTGKPYEPILFKPLIDKKVPAKGVAVKTTTTEPSTEQFTSEREKAPGKMPDISLSSVVAADPSLLELFGTKSKTSPDLIALGQDVAGTKKVTTEKPLGTPREKGDFGAEELLSLTQAGTGLAGLIGSGKRPEGALSKELLSEYAAASKLESETRYPIEQILRDIERERVALSAPTTGDRSFELATRFGASSKAQREKQSVIERKEAVESESRDRFKLARTQIRSGLARSIADERRRLFEDKLNAFTQSQAAWGNVLGAGIANFFGARQSKDYTKALEEAQKVK